MRQWPKEKEQLDK